MEMTFQRQSEASAVALMVEEVSTSETWVNFNVTTRCYIPEDSKLKKISIAPIIAVTPSLSKSTFYMV
jgi:hypothetical protein